MDHVFVVGTAGYDTVDVYGYGGVLAGEMNNVSITNCGVRDMELVSQEIQKHTLYLGGLAGSLSSTNVANSYVQGSTITADAGYTAAGIGGLAGVQGSGSPIENVYVQGSIHTSFQNAGGIAGIMNTEYDVDPEVDMDLTELTDVEVRSTTNDVLIH